MGFETTISYLCRPDAPPGSTWNPWYGCDPVGPGCANCFARRFICKLSRHPWPPKPGERRFASKRAWAQPLRWEKLLVKHRPLERGTDGVWQPQQTRRVLVDLCDPFDNDVPLGWFAWFLELIEQTPHLTWLLLTKRPQNIRDRLDSLRRLGSIPDGPERGVALAAAWLNAQNPHPPSNVWLGVSVEGNHQRGRIDDLLGIPAAKHWLSAEPLLGPLDLRPWKLFRDAAGRRYDASEVCWEDVDTPGAQFGGYVTKASVAQSNCIGDWVRVTPFPLLDWVVVGGESGPHHRPCHPDWIADIVAQCVSAGVPVFVKQDSAVRPGMQGRIPEALWKRKEVLDRSQNQSDAA